MLSRKTLKDLNNEAFNGTPIEGIELKFSIIKKVETFCVGMDEFLVTLSFKDKTESFKYSSGVGLRVYLTTRYNSESKKWERKTIPYPNRKYSRWDVQKYERQAICYPDIKSVIYCLLIDYNCVLEAGVNSLEDYLYEELGYDEMKPSELTKTVMDLRESAQKFERLFAGKIDWLNKYYENY